MIPTERDYREFLEDLNKVFNLGILYDQLTDEEFSRLPLRYLENYSRTPCVNLIYDLNKRVRIIYTRYIRPNQNEITWCIFHRQNKSRDYKIVSSSPSLESLKEYYVI